LPWAEAAPRLNAGCRYAALWRRSREPKSGACRKGKSLPAHHDGTAANQFAELMLEFEFEKPEISTCDCCGGSSTRLTRFVTKDDEAFAIYYAAYSESHSARRILALVSFGEWWIDDYVPESRVAFAFEMWADESEYKVGIIDVQNSPWHDVDIIGKKQTREEALGHPLIDDVFHITDHMTSDDPAIKEFFETVH
ncbi:MAG TPA: hypothetical protein VJV05_11890, partial [Pyrinomonadaceae bacterium]|nr:hypothetical protein [Pyrinomonadaceae bacterium]